jgi:hypothetical protein
MVNIVVAFLAGAAGVLGSYYNFKGTSAISQKEMVSELHQSIDSLREKAYRYHEEILTLKHQLYLKYDDGDSLRLYLDRIPAPAWVKITRNGWPDPVFVMWYINRAYEGHFGITLGRYLNKSDYAIHPKYLADIYYNLDLAVFTERDSFCKLSEAGPRHDGIVCKWPFTLEGHPAIAGVFLKREDLEQTLHKQDIINGKPSTQEKLQEDGSGS